MADVTESFPLPLTTGRSGVSANYSISGLRPDFSVAELPFFLAITDELPYVRQTADARRQQIDTSREPGEQTLSQWWVRDQDSWHRGAGIGFYEPGTDTKTQYRYDVSYGINPWTVGELSLHHAMETVTSASGACYATGAVVGGAAAYFAVSGGALRRVSGSTTVYTGGTPLTEPVVAGSKVLSGATAGILAGDTTGSTLSVLWTTASGTVMRPWWVKSRIIASKGANLLDLTLAGGNADTATPLWTHPDSTWTWSGVTESPTAILAAGYSNGYSAIYSFALKDSGSSTTPTLGPAVQIAELPGGEEVRGLRSYLGAFLAIGTTKGVRVGLIGQDSVQYGPVIVATTNPVSSFAARDTFIYGAVTADIQGVSGVVRIDLSDPISDLRFPWAWDVVSAGTGTARSVTFWGGTDRVVLAVDDVGILRESDTLFVPFGEITSGYIRYGTAEPKLFNRLKVRADTPGTTTVGIATIDGSGDRQDVFNLGGNFNTDEDVSLQLIADVPQAYAKVVLRLNASGDLLTSPKVNSWQCKATPVPKIQREIRIPLRLDDFEQDRQGVKIGYTGYAYERLAALEDIETTRSIVIVKDWTTGEAVSAQIRNVQMIRTTPPTRNRGNFGGVVYLSILKL